MKSNITKLLFSQAISNYNILLSEVKIYYITFSAGILYKSLFFLVKSVLHACSYVGKFQVTTVLTSYIIIITFESLVI